MLGYFNSYDFYLRSISDSRCVKFQKIFLELRKSSRIWGRFLGRLVRKKLWRVRKNNIESTHTEHMKRKIRKEWSVHTILYCSRRRNTEFNYRIISRVTDMFAKEARSWLSKLNLNFELNFIPNKCDAMNGSWLRIIQKPNTIFLWVTQKTEKCTLQKKESYNFLNIPRFWHLNRHFCYPVFYCNKSKWSIHFSNT